MSAADYTKRCLRHRATGQAAVVTGQTFDILGRTQLRLRHGDGAPERLPIDQVEAAYEWLPDVMAGPAVTVDAANVVPFPGRRPARQIPITVGPGDAA